MNRTFAILLLLVSTAQLPAISVARLWNEQNLSAIRLDFPNPAVHARNLFHSSVAMWDAWAAYDTNALGHLHRENATAGDVAAARREAVSFAAYRVLAARYSLAIGASTTLSNLNAQMTALGYDPNNTGVSGPGPAEVGNRVAATVLAHGLADGAREQQLYADPSYQPVNSPLVLEFNGTVVADPNRWQPLAFDVAFTQNGLVASKIQVFVASHWGEVQPVTLERTNGQAVYLDPGPPPLLGGAGDAEYRSGVVDVIEHSSRLDPLDGNLIDISPASMGNSTLGLNDGTGHAVNPATGQPYVQQLVPHGDYGRVVAEYWADGPDSETPPGHWNKLANEVVATPGFERRLGGTGPVLDELEWDVKMYLPLNASLHDSAIAVGDCKRHYDYIRPISAIRHMGGLGQSTDQAAGNYHPNGLLLVPGLIESATSATAATGQRHEGLIPGRIAIRVWGGEPADPENSFTGVKWIAADAWLPYQRDTFVTPAFAGYVSGHSGFSRAAAEVLTRLTGSAYFPGGLGTFHAERGEYLEFEDGPSVDVTLQWATYYDAADEAGGSRLYGGIHVPVDDGPGRIVGATCGIRAFDWATGLFQNSAPSTDIVATLTVGEFNNCTLRWNSQPGVRYTVEGSADFRNFIPIGPAQTASGSETVFSLSVAQAQQFFFRLRREDD